MQRKRLRALPLLLARTIFAMGRRRIAPSILLSGCLLAIGANAARGRVSPGEVAVVSQSHAALRSLQQGRERYAAGQFAAAIDLWQQSAAAFAARGETLGESLALHYLALAYQELGQWPEAEAAIASSLKRLADPGDGIDAETRQEILAKVTNAKGQLQWSRGQTEAALATWQTAARHYAAVGDVEGIAIAKINQAKALQTLGLSRQSRTVLQEVYENLGRLSDPALQVNGLLGLGRTLGRMGELEAARKVLAEGQQLATRRGVPAGPVLLELGNIERALGSRATAIGKPAVAEQHFATALDRYRQASGQPQGTLNQLGLYAALGRQQEALALLPQARESVRTLPSGREKVAAALSLAQSLTCLQPELAAAGAGCPDLAARLDRLEVPSPANPHRTPDRSIEASPEVEAIARVLATAVSQARSLQDPRAESHALGQLAYLYELTGQWDAARRLTQEALLLAETVQAPDIRYRWEWQLGRLARAQGKRDAAMAAYAAAIETLQTVRSDLIAVNPDVQFSFRDRIEPVYREYIALLLQGAGEKPPSPAALETAILNINSLQIAELENYLGCELPRLDLAEGTGDPHAAILYPIVLEDRVAVIFEIPGESPTLGYRETPIPRETVEATLHALQDNLRVPQNTPEVVAAASQVYQWLLRPVESVLEKSPQLETLVFVLDGALRNIPVAVLHDGERYLVEQGYGLAVAPRLELFGPQTAPPEITVAAGGIDIPQTIEGTPFPAIERVREELDRVAQWVETSEPLLNSDFTVANIQKKLAAETFSVIHWKTHGVFSSDPQETFLVAYNERIRAKDLNAMVRAGSRSGTQPLELLVLSACETALGDDRAVLGLAGVAVRTGARSVLATLWSAQDAPNTEFMARFYEELAKPGVTKAQATQRAQLALVREHGYTTPHIWANYTLTGNWL